jgi:hypothetical protein
MRDQWRELRAIRQGIDVQNARHRESTDAEQVRTS